MRKIVAILLGALLLSNCAALLVVGAAAGLVVYDKRSLRVMEKDARIFHVINKTIVTDPEFKDSRIDVNSFNQVVLLVGQVENARLRVIAEKIARETPAVVRVYDELEIAEPISLKRISKDSWISGEVRTKMLSKKDLESGSIKIVTDNGVVYLMGIVSKEQAKLAVDVARKVSGVTKVVKVFRYIV